MNIGDFTFNHFLIGFATAIVAFGACWLIVPMLGVMARMLALYTIVQEREAKVFQLYGRVVATLREPGLYILIFRPRVWSAQLFGNVSSVDLRLDQEYNRDQPVNAAEGTPMGIGVWSEMRIKDPVAYLFKHADPEGSLRANVRNAAVRSLSNMPLSDLLQNRHRMSVMVREQVSPKSNEWGYEVGSVYIRKVRFQNLGMVEQIERKVVNRLREQTLRIRQHGDNKVALIISEAERAAAEEHAKAMAVRPSLLGKFYQELGKDEKILQALFDCIEVDKLLETKAKLVLLPKGGAGDLGNIFEGPSADNG